MGLDILLICYKIDRWIGGGSGKIEFDFYVEGLFAGGSCWTSFGRGNIQLSTAQRVKFVGWIWGHGIIYHITLWESNGGIVLI